MNTRNSVELSIIKKDLLFIYVLKLPTGVLLTILNQLDFPTLNNLNSSNRFFKRLTSEYTGKQIKSSITEMPLKHSDYAGAGPGPDKTQLLTNPITENTLIAEQKRVLIEEDKTNNFNLYLSASFFKATPSRFLLLSALLRELATIHLTTKPKNVLTLALNINSTLLHKINRLKSDIKFLYGLNNNGHLTPRLGYCGLYVAPRCEHKLPNGHGTDTILEKFPFCIYPKPDDLGMICQNEHNLYFYLALRLEFEIQYVKKYLNNKEYISTLNRMLYKLLDHIRENGREQWLNLCNDILQKKERRVAELKGDHSLWGKYYVWQENDFYEKILPYGLHCSREHLVAHSEYRVRTFTTREWQESHKGNFREVSVCHIVEGTTSSLEYFFPYREEAAEFENLSRVFLNIAERIKKFNNSFTENPMDIQRNACIIA